VPGERAVILLPGPRLAELGLMLPASVQGVEGAEGTTGGLEESGVNAFCIVDDIKGNQKQFKNEPGDYTEDVKMHFNDELEQEEELEQEDEGQDLQTFLSDLDNEPVPTPESDHEDDGIDKNSSESSGDDWADTVKPKKVITKRGRGRPKREDLETCNLCNTRCRRGSNMARHKLLMHTAGEGPAASAKKPPHEFPVTSKIKKKIKKLSTDISQPRKLTLAQSLYLVVDLEKSGLSLEAFAEANAVFITSMKKWVEEKEDMQERVEAGLGEMYYVTKKSPKKERKALTIAQKLALVVEMEESETSPDIFSVKADISALSLKKWIGEKDVMQKRVEAGLGDKVYITKSEYNGGEESCDEFIEANEYSEEEDEDVFKKKKKYLRRREKGPSRIRIKGLERDAQLELHDDMWSCKLCDSDFPHLKNTRRKGFKHSLKRYVQRHIERVHMPEYFPQVTCELCGTVFKNKYGLHRHVAMYHDEDNTAPVLTCEVCGKGNMTKVMLIGHRRSHDPPIQCPVCSKELKGEKRLEEHIKRFHDPNRVIKKFTCEICGKSDLNRRSLAGHKRRVHAERFKMELESKVEVLSVTDAGISSKEVAKQFDIGLSTVWLIKRNREKILAEYNLLKEGECDQ
jgi:hypothetical protein